MISRSGRKNKLQITGIDNSQALMLKAGEDALSAKEAVRKTIEQIYENNRHLNTLDDTLVRILGETEKSISENADELLKKNSADKFPIDIIPEIRRRCVNEEPEDIVRQGLEDYIEETRKIRENAEAVALQARREVEAAQNHARVAIVLAQDKVKEADKLVEQAREENRIVREEARLAKEKAEASIQKVNEQLVRARNLICGSTLGENTEGHTIYEKSAGLSPAHIKDMYDPLHSISGFARMMLEDNVADRAEQKEILHIILQQTELLKERLDSISR